MLKCSPGIKDDPCKGNGKVRDGRYRFYGRTVVHTAEKGGWERNRGKLVFVGR